ncbi:unnamed protein product [Soboliphyme baturini]|uniref:Transmembrane protein n=1 Tax=Soboliphyme baturini TaxID=241478 RepID=A0A183IMV0_9BILA|nr:unnamed protein product [Soboliphyme baturini]
MTASITTAIIEVVIIIIIIIIIIITIIIIIIIIVVVIIIVGVIVNGFVSKGCAASTWKSNHSKSSGIGCRREEIFGVVSQVCYCNNSDFCNASLKSFGWSTPFAVFLCLGVCLLLYEL